jgi:hypothetical protein
MSYVVALLTSPANKHWLFFSGIHIQAAGLKVLQNLVAFRLGDARRVLSAPQAAVQVQQQI